MVQLVHYPQRWRVSDDESRRVMSEGEGACSPFFKVRSYLPLRGKQGWMTPRVGVKTTLTMETRHSGLLFPSKGPTFSSTLHANEVLHPRNCHFCLPAAGEGCPL